MCYYTQQSATIDQIGKRFRVKVNNDDNFLQSDYIIGFDYPRMPIIVNSSSETLSSSHTWGLIPPGKDTDFRKNTLNARIETLDSKPSFHDIVSNRCLVIATAYFDWHWNDAKGKSKTKYQVNSADDQIFAFGGLFNSWTNLKGEKISTFTIVTTRANEQMRYVHNRKAAEDDQRMPLLLRKDDEEQWLDASNPIEEFAYPNYEQNLLIFPV